MSIYYFKKYSHTYSFRDADDVAYAMCTISIPQQIQIYAARMGRFPQSFFDCGAATGELVDEATKLGMDAAGIEIAPEKYKIPIKNQQYFIDGHIQIASILDVAPVQADLAYCNGTLTYMNETTLPLALSKFKNVGMLIAIHNTTEDIMASIAMNDPIVHDEPRLIRSNMWWIDTFRKNGFLAEFDVKHRCFCVRPLRACAKLQFMLRQNTRSIRFCK